VSSDYPVIREFSRKCPPATSAMPDPPRIFPTDVICSEADADMLPYTMNSSRLRLTLFTLPTLTMRSMSIYM
jgi:hypothetical protein